MKTTKKWMGKLASLMMALVLICTLLPVQADAMVRNDVPVICAALDSAGEVVDGMPGIPMLSGDSLYMLTDDEFYDSRYDFVGLIDETIVELEYLMTFDGIAYFTFDYADTSVCAPEHQPRVNEQYTIQAMNTDAEIVSYSAVITGYDSNTTDEGFYWVDVETNMRKSDVVAPAAILDSSGGVVAVMVDEGSLSFNQPLGSSGSNGGGSGSNTPSRQPDEPTEAPEPPTTPTRPAVTEAPTTPENPTNPPEPDENNLKKYLIPIVGAVALIVLAVVAVLILRKPKPAAIPPQPPVYPPQPPVWEEPDVTKPGGPSVANPVTDAPGWVTVPESGYSLVDSSGVLGGRTFQISPAGSLIGRAANADIQYPADTKGVSRNHCRVYMQGNSLMVIDNGSTSGTYLLGKGQLRTGNPTEVREGDVICLGSKKISLTVKKN